MEPTTVIAIYAAVVSTIVLLVQVAEFSRNADDLRLSISTGVVMGALERVTGTDHVIQVTVASRGGRLVGVSGLSLRLNDGRSIPVMDPMPVNGSRELPAVLERGQFATYWLRYDSTERELRAQGARLEAVVANLTDGTNVEKRVGPTWRNFGS